MNELRLLLAQLIIVFLLAVTTWFAVTHALYWRIWWLDIPMHLLGGAWAGVCSIWLFARSGNSTTLIRCLVFALFVGVAWEAFEYSEGIPVTGNVSYPFDTAKDLVMDLLGAAFGWALAKKLL